MPIISDLKWPAMNAPKPASPILVRRNRSLLRIPCNRTAGDGDAVCVAVTSTGSPTMAAGVATVQAVASAAVQSIVVR